MKSGRDERRRTSGFGQPSQIASIADPSARNQLDVRETTSEAATNLEAGRPFADSNRAKVEATFLAILGRAPNRTEMELFRRDLDRDGVQGIHDMVWTLANTHEFRFIQ